MKVATMSGIANKFLRHVMPGVIRPLHVLWNEIIGFLFTCLAVYASVSVFQSIRQLHTPTGSIFRVCVSVFFAALMAFFGIGSFLRARKISRS
jgi:hypothetical protein